MLAPLSSLALLALLPLSLACPPSCECLQDPDGRDALQCGSGTEQFVIKGLMDQSVEINCLDDFIDLKCSNIPLVTFARNQSLAKLKIVDCALDGPLTCWLGRFGATTIEYLVLNNVKTALLADHVTGLDDVKSLLMYKAGVQKTIPLEALQALPSLKEHRLRDANIPAPQPMAGLPSLVYLELSSGIEQLADGAFDLEKLENLQLWGNRIRNITKENFKGLPSLKILSIDRNVIGSFPARVFSPMPRLRELSFVANAVETVHSEAFYGLAELKTIKAFNNGAPLSLAPRSLADLPSLQEVRLDNCNIPTALPPELFANSNQLKTLSLTNNNIELLPGDLFKDQHSLVSLDLSGNKILELFAKTFSPLSNLVELNLDRNFIEKLVDTDLFKGLSKLQTLRVNNNHLIEIEESAISHNLALKNIYFSNNNLTLVKSTFYNDYDEPYQSPFRMLSKSLENLDLSGNRISQIFNDWQFVLNEKMKVLNLSRNVITDLNDADMQFISDREDTVIDLRYNQITSIDLKNNIFMSKDDLTNNWLKSSILLDNNPFACDCINQNFLLKLRNRFPYFNTIPKLVIGDAQCFSPPRLKGTLLANVDPLILTCPLEDCPKNCTCDRKPSTNHLELTCSSLPDSLPDPIKYGMNGTVLTLKDKPNTLQLPNHVDKLILNDLHMAELLDIPSSVRYVDLTDNDLTEIPVALLLQNVTVRLAGNPLLCDCSHDEAVRALQRFRHNVEDNATVRCSDLQSPWSVDAPRLCSVQRAAILGGSLAVLSVILVILAGLYYRYSVQVKIFIYSCEKLRWLVAEEDVDKDKKYDAFISFSHKDEKFVAEELIPVLESGSRPFKLCVHYRDWIVGEWIPAQIANSVEQSRRTIIVLSKSFVESVWGTMEFRIAYKRAQEEKRTRLVVILLEDAPPEGELDVELRAYLSTNTYVKWGDPWFWEKLRYALAGGRVVSKPKSEKAPKGGLNARLNSRGQLVNDSKDTISTELSMC